MENPKVEKNQKQRNKSRKKLKVEMPNRRLADVKSSSYFSYKKSINGLVE